MKAITLWQPWASMIAIGCKVNETRSWKTLHRGPIAIHAAKRFREDEMIFARDVILFHRPIQDAIRTYGMSCLADFPLGAIVAVANIIDVIPTEDAYGIYGVVDYELGDYTPGRFAWLLEDIKHLPPIPCRGAQGIWNLPDDIERMVSA